MLRGVAGSDFVTMSISFNRSGLESDRVVAVIVSSDKGIFALYKDAGFSFDQTSGVITLEPIDLDLVAGEVTLEVTLALLAFHEEGDGKGK